MQTNGLGEGFCLKSMRAHPNGTLSYLLYRFPFFLLLFKRIHTTSNSMRKLTESSVGGSTLDSEYLHECCSRLLRSPVCGPLYGPALNQQPRAGLVRPKQLGSRTHFFIAPRKASSSPLRRNSCSVLRSTLG